MAKFVLDNAYLSYGGEDLSDHVQSITINYTAAEVDKTAMGDSSIARLGGLKDWSADVTFIQDFAAGEVDATLFSLVGTSAAFIAKPDGASTTTVNPSYTGVGIIFDYTPIDGSVGDLATATVTITGSDGNVLTRATS